MATDKWHDEDEVLDDLDELKSHIRQLEQKYGDRMYMFADDPCCEWAGVSVVLERDKDASKYPVKIVRRSVRMDLWS